MGSHSLVVPRTSLLTVKRREILEIVELRGGELSGGKEENEGSSSYRLADSARVGRIPARLPRQLQLFFASTQRIDSAFAFTLAEAFRTVLAYSFFVFFLLVVCV